MPQIINPNTPDSLSIGQNLIYNTNANYVIGSAAQLALEQCTHKYQSSDQTFRNKDGTELTDGEGGTSPFPHGSKIIFVGSDALSNNMEFIADRLIISMYGSTEIICNGYKILVSGNNCRCEFYTDEDYDKGLEPTDESDAAQWENARVIKNRGFRNRIWLNGRMIFSGDLPMTFFSPIEIKDPYILEESGQVLNGIPDVGVNDDENCFCDIWKHLRGDETLELGPIFNPLSSSIYWKYLYMAADGGRFIRPVSLGDGTVDPNPHERISPTLYGSTTISTYTSSASDEISGISDSKIKEVKIGCRIFDVLGSVIPSYLTFTKATTLIAKIVHNGADDNSIFLIDSETRAAVVVSASGDLTVDWGGNTGLSYADDAFQAFQIGASADTTGARDYWGRVGTRDVTLSSSPLANYAGISYNTIGQGGANMIKPMDDGTHGPPKTGPQTQPISVNRYSYMRS
jgi:hypothetical protein